MGQNLVIIYRPSRGAGNAGEEVSPSDLNEVTLGDDESFA